MTTITAGHKGQDFCGDHLIENLVLVLESYGREGEVLHGSLCKSITSSVQQTSLLPWFVDEAPLASVLPIGYIFYCNI